MTQTRILPALLIASMAFGLQAFDARADAILFDNGVSSGPQTNFGNTAGGQELFEDFTLGVDSTITGIEWQQHDHNAASYNFTRVTIFDALPFSAPSVFTADIVATSTPNATGTIFVDWDGFDYEIGGLSIALSPGTYWIGLNSDFSGVRSGWDNTLGGVDTIPGFRLVNASNPPPGTVISNNLAFSLTGRVPEPTTLLLLGLGLAGLGFRRLH